MIITKNKTITEVQQEFQQKFPYLKIEFYTLPHKSGEASSPLRQIDASKKIGELTDHLTETELSINGHLKVNTLEENLKAQFGLNAQVFRQSGDIWLQTTSTDHWTLSDQNARGQQSSEKIKD